MIEYDKFIYLDMYKTGSTHVASLLKLITTGKPVKVMRHAPLTKVHPLRPKAGKFVFATVRNPWDWYVSYWAYSGEEGRAYNRHFIDALGEREAARLYDRDNPREAFGAWMRLIHDPAFLKKALPRGGAATTGLSDFLGLCSYRFMRVTTPWPGLFLRRLVLPDAARAEAWLSNRALYDVCFRSETLDDDFRALVEREGPRLGFRPDALKRLDRHNREHLNRSERSLSSYRDYYDDALAEMVARRDRPLISLFGYSF